MFHHNKWVQIFLFHWYDILFVPLSSYRYESLDSCFQISSSHVWSHFFFFWFSWISVVTQLYASCNTCANLSSKSKQPFCQGTNTSFAYFFFIVVATLYFLDFDLVTFSLCVWVMWCDMCWVVLSCTESHARVATVVSCKSDITSLSSVL